MPKQNNNNEHKRKIARAITLVVYVAFAVLPLYWMLSMSLKTNVMEIGRASCRERV